MSGEFKQYVETLNSKGEKGLDNATRCIGEMVNIQISAWQKIAPVKNIQEMDKAMEARDIKRVTELIIELQLHVIKAWKQARYSGDVLKAAGIQLPRQNESRALETKMGITGGVSMRVIKFKIEVQEARQ